MPEKNHCHLQLLCLLHSSLDREHIHYVILLHSVQNYYVCFCLPLLLDRSLSNDYVHSTDEVPNNKPTTDSKDGRPDIRIIKTCLNFRMTGPNETPVLLDASCFDKQPFICEARVQTVTYSTWFRANWVDFMLGFLLVRKPY